MTIKSINDEIRKVEEYIKKDYEDGDDYILKYELNAKLQTLQDVKKLMDIKLKDCEYCRNCHKKEHGIEDNK